MRGVALLVGVCALAVAVLVWAEFCRSQPVRAAVKMIASSAFVAIACQLDAAMSRHGRWLLAAFALSWIGDALLLSARSRVFLAGLFAFLAAHVAFAGAFLSLPLSRPALWIAIAVMGASGLLMLRWLWPHLKPFYRLAVSAYVAALVAMAAPAIAATAAGGDWRYAAGALAVRGRRAGVCRLRRRCGTQPFHRPGPCQQGMGIAAVLRGAAPARAVAGLMQSSERRSKVHRNEDADDHQQAITGSWKSLPMPVDSYGCRNPHPAAFRPSRKKT